MEYCGLSLFLYILDEDLAFPFKKKYDSQPCKIWIRKNKFKVQKFYISHIFIQFYKITNLLIVNNFFKEMLLFEETIQSCYSKFAGNRKKVG